MADKLRAVTIQFMINLGESPDEELEADLVGDIKDGIERAVQQHRLSYTDIELQSVPMGELGPFPC